MFKDKVLLITGGTGSFGNRVLNRFLNTDVSEIRIFSRDEKKQEDMRISLNNPKLKFYIGDVRDYESINQAMRGVDYVFHAAALKQVPSCEFYPMEAVKTNIIGTENVLEYARSENIPVVYAGSSSVHGDVYANPYTFSKYQGEELCKLYTKVYNLPTAVCRFYNVYGKYQLTEGDYCCVLGIFERQFDNKEPLTITGDGEQRRDFTYVGDIVDGLIRCGFSLYDACALSGESFELGNGENYSINEIVGAFGDYPTKYIDARPGEMRETLNVSTKAQEMLSWNPKGNVIKFIKENLI